jgi:hypothetical protein
MKFPFTGKVEGRAITFDIPFPGPPPYTIRFKGSLDGDGDEIYGTSARADGGPVFLGHAGEVDEPQHPWSATKGMKPNNHPDKPPDDDDDDDRPKTPRRCGACL